METHNLLDLLNYIEDLKPKKIFVLCGVNSFKKLSIKKALNNLDKKYNFFYYYKKQFLPEYKELIDITKNIKRFDPDLILAIGGGGVMDYAKIANCINLDEKLLDHIKNYSYPYKKKFTKLVALPTTAGSGAECTSNAVIYVDGIKYSFESNLLLPDQFFLIPEFILNSPFKVNASAGFDALAQAMESLISMKSNEESKKYALKSIKILNDNFLNFLGNQDLNLCAKMLIASNFSGKAINITKTTAPHAVSYPFSSLYGFSHGHAVSLFIENFFEFNFNNLNNSKTEFNLEKRFEEIFKVLDVKNIKEFVIKIKKIKFQSKLNDNLVKQNINVKSNLDKIMSGINVLRLNNNPIRLKKNDIIEIISKK